LSEIPIPDFGSNGSTGNFSSDEPENDEKVEKKS